jgi:hypothetical protein
MKRGSTCCSEKSIKYQGEKQEYIGARRIEDEAIGHLSKADLSSPVDRVSRRHGAFFATFFWLYFLFLFTLSRRATEVACRQAAEGLRLSRQGGKKKPRVA